MTALPQGWPPYTPADLTPPSPSSLTAAARVALAYGRLHTGDGARWAEVLFGVGGPCVGPADATTATSRGER